MSKKISRETFGEFRAVIRTQRDSFSESKKREELAASKSESHKPYFMYDDSLEDVEHTFNELAPWGFEHYLKVRFPEKYGNLVGLELGGPGSKLFKGLQHCFVKSVGVTVLDLREKYQSVTEKETDKLLQHEVISADIFSKDALDKVDKWLNGEKADFIVERMQAGWHQQSKNMAFFAKYFAGWYERLGQRGSIFVQTPFITGSGKNLDLEASIQYKHWIELMQNKYKNLININAPKFQTLLIEKTDKSPEKIQVLNF